MRMERTQRTEKNDPKARPDPLPGVFGYKDSAVLRKTLAQWE